MKNAALAVLLLVLIPLQASALDTTELLGLVAMPLAVAAVSEATGVPAGDLSTLVATLNRAEVAPTQVIHVVRYAPAAIVVQRDEPFVAYVDQQVSQGVTGARLVTTIEDRYRTYDLDPHFVTVEQPTIFVASNEFVPTTVMTRVTEYRTTTPVINDIDDLLAFVAMPLAVSAVANLSGVPVNELSGLVATLNNALVPPAQVIEVIRYAPVALVADAGQPFVPFLRSQINDGITGPRLVQVIDQRLRSYDLQPRLLAPAGTTIVVDDDFFPAEVVSRVAAGRAHPHGGPPGQLKKVAGVQTGAEIVHGTKPGRDKAVRSVRVDDSPRVIRVEKRAGGGDGVKRGRRERTERVRQPEPARGGPMIPAEVKGNRGRGPSGHPGGAAKAPGQGHGQGKGQGKGKGKG